MSDSREGEGEDVKDNQLDLSSIPPSGYITVDSPSRYLHNTTTIRESILLLFVIFLAGLRLSMKTWGDVEVMK